MDNNTAALGSSQKLFDNETFVLRKPGAVPARKLQLRILNVMGQPFSEFVEGLENEDIAPEQTILYAITKALHSLEPDVSVELIKDLCEMTINQSKGRPTSYEMDFDPITSSKDLEVAIWVCEEILGKFLKALSESNMLEQITSKLLVPEEELQMTESSSEPSGITVQT